MTPKAKAFNLYFKFIYDVVADHEKAKQCALIAVDEILEIEYWKYMESGGKQEQIYWQEVKQEIQKL